MYYAPAARPVTLMQIKGACRKVSNALCGAMFQAFGRRPLSHFIKDGLDLK
jgi:hypothetical protein